MAADSEHSLSRRLVPNLVAFFIGLALAWFLKWETTDLVWSLWLSSLVIGYSTILLRIGYGVYFGRKVIFDDGFTGPRWGATLIGIGIVVFLLGFFSLHFCGFHAGHSVFLSAFFPLDDLPEEAFARAFLNPLLLWKEVFQHLMVPYGLFLIPALIAERKALLRPFLSRDDDSGSAQSQRKDFMEDAFAGPYKNVMRMHILIFFFAGAHFLKLDSFVVYVVVSAVYFFPWKDLKEWRKTRSAAATE